MNREFSHGAIPIATPPHSTSSTNGSLDDWRRRTVLVISIVLLLACGIVTWQYGTDGTARFVASATGRVGLVMGALWLAWPSLRRPASWLPPGLAVGGVIVLAVVAAQPRLAFVAIPAMGVLFTIASVVRAFR
ncbi:hypothetical protein N9N28_03265 [Rubripirellula amarantea]|uniref:hypothetical protein n=1 Tax=Rubripirellula amarantea TaxID=2527999 RepID=UPI001F5F1E8F|nr:hypothetical protein [Rubripirellula amarantea]MDA8743633.1 hypothetical protein [Rubripirellula amarantea]